LPPRIGSSGTRKTRKAPRMGEIGVDKRGEGKGTEIEPSPAGLEEALI